jgi:TetR/AcrR family transcriptional regulator, mexJK operon transcriptional repressor
MNMAAPMRGPGRPKDQGKRAAIITAANRLFMERGYPGVTMEAVAASAGVSKMTVDGHFHDKAALFGAVVRATCDQMLGRLTGLDETGVKRDLEPTLVAFGVALLGMVLSPRIVMMSHLLMGMLMKDRALAESFHDSGPGNVQAALARFLADAAARGEVSIDSPEAAADDLVSLWEGSMPKRIALGLVTPPTEADIEARVRRGTRVFLRAYQVAAG